jgi:hypothetical protein
VARALREAAARGPLLCVLDDLHAADLASIELATFVARALRSEHLCLLFTWRDREAGVRPVVAVPMESHRADRPDVGRARSPEMLLSRAVVPLATVTQPVGAR